VGERVVDRDAAEAEPAIVVDVLPDTPARDVWIGSLDKTVADANPGYNRDAPVIVVAYVSTIDGLSIDDVCTLANRGDIPTYTFPAPRLSGAES
jgi:hypothetical protein